MRFASIFSGIDGFALAARRMNWEIIFQVDFSEFAQSVLEARFPESEKHLNIEDFNASKYRGSVDILAGGFPCQPFSISGKRSGREDDRFLWNHFFRVVKELKPALLVAENVPGLLSIEDGVLFEQILFSLENEGYQTVPVILPSSAVGAFHERKRLFIIAYAPGIRLHKNQVQDRICSQEQIQSKSDFIARITLPAYSRWAEPGTNGNADALPITLDEHRLHALGNSVDPVLVYELFQAIQYSIRDFH